MCEERCCCRSQHIFVDVREPQNVFRLTYNCIDCPDNQVTCNDGYHIMHHLNSKRHWSELPHSFLDSYEQHAAQQGDPRISHASTSLLQTSAAPCVLRSATRFVLLGLQRLCSKASASSTWGLRS